MGGEFVSVMNTWQDANSVFDRVLGETYGPFASPTAPDEAAAILAESRLQGQLLAANDAPRERTSFCLVVYCLDVRIIQVLSPLRPFARCGIYRGGIRGAGCDDCGRRCSWARQRMGMENRYSSALHLRQMGRWRSAVVSCPENHSYGRRSRPDREHTMTFYRSMILRSNGTQPIDLFLLHCCCSVAAAAASLIVWRGSAAKINPLHRR